MAHLKNLTERATLLDLFQAYPRMAQLSMALAQEILRAPGELSASEREVLFAFGSGVNACHFCVGAHTAVAERMGVAPGVIEAALADIASAPVDTRLKPLLHFVKKLTETPSRVSAADADAVRAAGWSDKALHEAISVCALQNFFNRWVDGAGVDAGHEFFAGIADRLVKDGYQAPAPE